VRKHLPGSNPSQQVIERVRASKVEFEARERTNGRKRGRDWAMSIAALEQLRAVADLEFDGTSGGYSFQFDQAVGKDASNWRESFWNVDASSDVPSNQYVEAFVEGARDVWKEIAEKI
jgi:hypothetical protein